MKNLEVFFLLLVAFHFGLSRIATIQNIRHLNAQTKHTPQRKLHDASLEEDMKISSDRDDLFTQYLRYSLRLQKDEKDSEKLAKLVHTLLNSVDDFSLMLNDHISGISNQMNTQKLDFFIKSNPYGAGLD